MKYKLNILAVVVSFLFIRCGSSQQNPDNGITPHLSEKNLCEGAKADSSDGYGGGDGTQRNPYLVCTNDQFKAIQGDTQLKRFFKLTHDLDFSSEGPINIIAISPLASIDGDNHTVRNITIEHGHGYKDNGLFGQLVKDLNGNPDEIKNLILENVKIIGDGKEDGGGVIAAANFGGIISNVHIKGTVKIDYPDTNSNTWSVGGIVGTNSSLIENSSFDGNVTGVNVVGGIAGTNDGVIRNSTVSGTVLGLHGVGGLVGIQLKPGIIDNNSTSAKVSGIGHFGSLIGMLCDRQSYTDCELLN